MKRLLSLLLCFLLCGCAVKTPESTVSQPKPYFYGIWVTYAELDNMARGDFEENFKELCKNSKDLGANALFVHVRPFCDSVYPSEIFPLRSFAQNLPYDALEKMIFICKENGLEFHAWINPYRVSANSDTSLLEENSPAKTQDGILLEYDKGLYLDPSETTARELILSGIKEITENYDIDGIHFDDYFYPTTDENCDLENYTEYKNSAINPLPLYTWRRVNVTLLISGVASLLKNSDKRIVFTVSPAADIEKNKNVFYADIENWCNAGYLDAVIPQLYFGFDYPNEKFSFERLLLDWINLTDQSPVKLYIGLSPYKLDTSQSPDNEEWENGTDIVARQILHIKNQGEVDGAVFFSSSYLFSKEENFTIQKERIIKVIKE